MKTNDTAAKAENAGILTKAHRILEIVEALMVTANAATEPESKAHKVELIRRHLDRLNELMEEHPFLPKEDRERLEALTLVLSTFAGQGINEQAE